MKRLFFFVVLMLVLVYGAFKGVSWYAIGKAVDEFKTRLGDEGSVAHGWIFSAFSGEAGVHDLRITSFKLRKSVQIDRLAVVTDNFIELMGALSSLAEGRLPDNLQVTFEGITLPTSAMDWSVLDVVIPADDEKFQPLGIQACSELTMLTAADYQALGYSEFEINGDLTYRTTDDGNKQLNWHSESKQLGELRVIAQLPTITGSQLPGGQASDATPLQMPGIETMQILLNDGGYFRRLSYYCGERTGLDRQSYSRKAAEAWQRYLARFGVRVDPGLRDLYQTYLADGGLLDIRLKFAPGIAGKPVHWNFLPEYLRAIDFDLAFNGKEVTDAGVVIDVRAFTAQISPAPEEPQKKAITIEEKAPQYYELQPSALTASYLGKKVRVSTADRTVEGDLIGVDEYGIEVQARVGGGEVVYPVKFPDIKKLEMWLKTAPVPPRPQPVPETATPQQPAPEEVVVEKTVTVRERVLEDGTVIEEIIETEEITRVVEEAPLVPITQTESFQSDSFQSDTDQNNQAENVEPARGNLTMPAPVAPPPPSDEQ